MAADAVLDLLALHDGQDVGGRGGTHNPSRLQCLEQSHHLASGGLAEAERLVHLEPAGAAHAARAWSRLDVSANLAERSGLGQTDRVQIIVHGICRNAIEHQIRGGVVADDDHQRGEVPDRQLGAVLEIGEDAGATDLVGGAQPDPLVPLHGASRNERFERAEDRQLDGARRANGAIGIDADIPCGAQILGVQRDRGSLAFDAGFEPGPR